MSVQSQINRIKLNVEDALTAVGNYGVTVPSTAKSDDLATLINSILVKKYYTGSTAPASSLGNDGDLYLQI